MVKIAERILVTFIICITFLTSFFTLTALMPIAFTSVPDPTYLPQIENYTSAEERIQYSVWASGNLTRGEEVNVYEGDLKLKFNWLPTDVINAWFVTWEWWIFFRGKRLWMPNQQRIVEDYRIEWSDVELYLSEDLNSSKFILYSKNIEYSFLCIFSIYNGSRDGSLAQAWNSGEMSCFVGSSIENLRTKLSAWSLIASLLTFQTPNVHPIINIFIAIPVYASIGYIIWYVIKEILPFT